MRNSGIAITTLLLIFGLAGSGHTQGYEYQGSQLMNPQMMYGYEHGGYGFNNYNISPEFIASRALSMANNTLILAEGYINSIENGKILFSQSETYIKRATDLYNNKQYEKAFEYALASFNLNRAIIHIYLAIHISTTLH